MLINNLILKN